MRNSVEYDPLAWLKKAAEDELSARAVLKEGAPSTGCFLSQQMAEKFLKGLLVFYGKEFLKVHDLLELETLLLDVDPGVRGLHDDLKLLNRYYVETRYPGDYPEFSLTECKDAYEAALRIKEFVLKKIKPRAKGGFSLLGIIIAIAVIAFLAGGGLYFSKIGQQKSLLETGIEAKKKAEELKGIIEGQQERVTQALGEPAKIDTSNWKTYRNDQYGFEVQYPSNWAYNYGIGFMFVCFMDEKYNFEGGECRGGPSLSIQEGSFRSYVPEKESRVFHKEDAWDEQIDIYFFASGKKIYAECDLYLDLSVIQYCNQILSTFKLTR